VKHLLKEKRLFESFAMQLDVTRCITFASESCFETCDQEGPRKSGGFENE
jgi:hypothetical protein